MGYEEFSVSLTNRSIRTIKTELEFLVSNSEITPQQLATILAQLPAETPLHIDASGANATVAAPTAQLNNLALTNGHARANTNASTPSVNEKVGFYGGAPPAYGTPAATTPAPPPPPPAAAPLAHATALYAYTASDAGDLTLAAQDRVAVTEYMNAEWWKGRNERTGMEGIFPRNYVRVEEKALGGPPQPSNYGNMPLDVASGAQPAPGADGGKAGKGKEAANKFGKKLGNAAIFGAGATIGGNIVNSIF